MTDIFIPSKRLLELGRYVRKQYLNIRVYYLGLCLSAVWFYSCYC